jgi:ABC-type Mn2+/Zn2+ transport system permease subunit
MKSFFNVLKVVVLAVLAFFLLGIGLAVALIAAPALIAYKMRHQHKKWIMWTSILGTLFFGIGWLVALAWCFVVPFKETYSNVVYEY